MKSPVELSGPRVRICDNADYPWERTEPGERGRGLNEAPQVLKHGNRTFVTYSCGASWLPSYKLGLLELVGDDPLDPASWTKRPRPVFESTEHTYGVGHSCFVRSPDGSQWWHVYHAKRDRNPGWRRAVFVQPMDFGPRGMPRLGKPVAAGEVLTRPAGEVVKPLALPHQSSLGRAAGLSDWSYYGHHQFFQVAEAGVHLGRVPEQPINDYRSGEKLMLQSMLPNDFSAEVTIDFLGDAGANDAGVVFRTSGPSIGYDAHRGYFAGLIPRAGIVIFGIADGQHWTEIARAPIKIDVTVPQRFGVTAVGERITISLGGKPVFTTTESTFAGGTLGLRVVNAHARFSNLTIESRSPQQ